MKSMRQIVSHHYHFLMQNKDVKQDEQLFDYQTNSPITLSNSLLLRLAQEEDCN